MINLSLLFKKTLLVALVAALALAALPLTSASASGLGDPTNPPADNARLWDERLEKAWAHLQQSYARQGRDFEHAGQFIEKMQSRIDLMNAKGKDTAALQAALDAYEEALQEAHAIYESAAGIVSAHQGFDSAGKVTDREKAIVTIKQVLDKMRETRQMLTGPRKALREAIIAFRDANRPADTSSS